MKHLSKKLEDTKGITLIALVITIIVLLILAGVSLSGVFSERGIFKRSEGAGEKYNEAKARETLETILLADGQYEKRSNPEYNQDGFLNNLITTEIPGSEIKGDVAIIGGKYAYELDRSVPKIGHYLGLYKDLVFPTVEATATLAADKKNATIEITASEGKKGINKIEVWLLGEKIEEYTYNPAKSPATENYTANQNGEYTIKAYGELMDSKTVEVTGILASVKFEPNGSAEWKKTHSTTVTIEETAEKVVKAKYVWTNSATTPNDNQFPEEQTFISGDTITGGNETMTGTYYLWTMLETQSGAKVKWRSEGFNFDNEGPTITAFTATPYSVNGITLSVTAIDTESGITKFELYVDNAPQDGYIEILDPTTLSTTKTINIEKLVTGSHNCYVRITDNLGHVSSTVMSERTKLYCWSMYTAVKEPKTVYLDPSEAVIEEQMFNWNNNWDYWTSKPFSYNSATGEYTVRSQNGHMLSKTFTSGLYVRPYFSGDTTIWYLVEKTGEINGGTVTNSFNVWNVKKIGPVTKEVPTGPGTFRQKVNSTNSGAYPANGAQNGFWYIKTDPI